MNVKNKVLLTALGMAMSTQALAAGDLLTGKTRLACEALLCLSTGSPPSACAPSLSEYFSIDFDDFSDTLRGRIDFLNLCPVSSQTAPMRSLVSAIAHGAGRCDAQSLNSTLVSYIEVQSNNSYGFGGGTKTVPCISNTKPSYCSVYESHEYTDLHGGAHYVVTNTYQEAQGAFGMGMINGGGRGNSNQTISCGHWVD